jgi:hypothetical protein
MAKAMTTIVPTAAINARKCNRKWDHKNVIAGHDER